MEFYTKSNFQTCLAAFNTFLSSTYGVAPERLADLDSDIKAQLYATMKALSASPALLESSSLRQLNNHALNRVKATIVERYSLASQPMPNPPSELQPAITSLSAEKEQAAHLFERMMTQRQGEYAAPSIKPLPAPTSGAAEDAETKAINPEDFSTRMAALENLRGDQSAWLESAADAMHSHSITDDPKRIFTTVTEQSTPAPAPAGNNNTRAEAVIMPPDAAALGRQELVRYALISGADRDSSVDKQRFRFHADLSGFRFRNVVSVEFTSLIMPCEVATAARASSTREFQHEFGLNQPYLVLASDEMDGVYEGTNDTARRACCVFRHHTTFQAPNGRGYVILKPLQKERKQYSPTPLASLASMSVSILKPNGALFNASQDLCKCCKIEYEPYNRLYLKLVMDKYFDRNEFFVGDTVFVRDIRVQAAPFLETFLNRAEGHEVVQVGPANQAGFHRFFYVRAPVELDQARGVLELLPQALPELTALTVVSAPGSLPATGSNAACTCETAPIDVNSIPTSSSPVPGFTPGAVVNMSLQASLSLRVTTSESDASSVLRVQNI